MKVSVIIATYKRHWILLNRAIPSVLKQTFTDWELIVIGDGCPEFWRTEEVLKSMGDPRIRYENLPQPGLGKYPKAEGARWQAGGVYAFDRGIELAQGEWISFLNDDDSYLPHRIEILLSISEGKDFVHAPVLFQMEDGAWQALGEPMPSNGTIDRISFMYKASLGVREDPLCWTYEDGEVADWTIVRHLLEKNPAIGFTPEPLGRHYRDCFRGGKVE